MRDISHLNHHTIGCCLLKIVRDDLLAFHLPYAPWDSVIHQGHSNCFFTAKAHFSVCLACRHRQATNICISPKSHVVLLVKSRETQVCKVLATIRLCGTDICLHALYFRPAIVFLGDVPQVSGTM